MRHLDDCCGLLGASSVDEEEEACCCCSCRALLETSSPTVEERRLPAGERSRCCCLRRPRAGQPLPAAARCTASRLHVIFLSAVVAAAPGAAGGLCCCLLFSSSVLLAVLGRPGRSSSSSSHSLRHGLFSASLTPLPRRSAIRLPRIRPPPLDASRRTRRALPLFSAPAAFGQPAARHLDSIAPALGLRAVVW